MNGRIVAGRYELERELGRGGMGTVWLGRDRLVDREVAVKEIRPPQGLPDGERETFGKRALLEARSAARVHHPGAVTVHDIVPATGGDDAVYLIMEYLPGRNLAQAVHDDGPLPDQRIAEIGLRVLSVLEAAHELGIVHRDIKPSNIMIGPDGKVTLADFSIAHTVGETRLTRSGTMGTGAYMAPELFESRDITPAADLWSLGATLSYAAAGKGPFDRDSTAATLRAILFDDIPVPACSPELTAAIIGLLTRDPGQRATVPRVRQQLEAVIGRPAAGIAAGVPVAAVGAEPVTDTVGLARSPVPSPVYPGGLTSREEPWEQAPTGLAPPRPVPLPPPTPPRTVPPVPAGRRRLAVGLLGTGIFLSIVSMFLPQGPTISSFSAPPRLVSDSIGIATWIGAIVWILAGRTRARDGGLYGIAIGTIAIFGFVQEIYETVYGPLMDNGTGLAASMAGGLACTAGAAACCRLRPAATGSRSEGTPRREFTGLRVAMLVSAIGLAVCSIPDWYSYGGDVTGSEDLWDAPIPMFIANVVILLVPLVIVVIAAYWRSVSDGFPLLAAAAVIAVSNLVYTLFYTHYDYGDPAYSIRIDPAFWFYFIFALGLIASAVWAFRLSREERPAVITESPVF